jgi:uncharacterized SAM-binding protein YcdF (DUF218 family)
MKKKTLKYGLIIIALVISSITIHSYYNFWRKPQQIFMNNSVIYDAIIVPGVPYDKQGWSVFMKWRVYWAVHLHKNNIAKNIIFSGGAVHTPYFEAEIMKKYAIKLGVDSNHIFTEIKAEHSTENLFNCNLIAIKNNFKLVALATDPFQSYRLESFIDKVNPNIDILPLVYQILSKENLVNITINDSSAFVQNFVALRDRESFFERMKGTNGEKIDFNQSQ